MGKKDETADLVEKVLDAASNHATDTEEPDHEVGDLQQALRAAWEVMTPAQRQKVFGGLELWES